MFKRFQCIFVRHHEASFPVSYTDYRSNDNNWVTEGIKISCTKKRELYSLNRNNKDNIQIRDYYKQILQHTKESNKLDQKTIFPQSGRNLFK
jgi:hypothetical protein